MGKVSKVLLFLLLMVSPVVSHAVIYTVSTSGNDSSCGNIGTIKFGINNCARNPGDILDIRGGTYFEQLHRWDGGINWPNGTGWADNEVITFRGHVGETVIIQPVCSGTTCDGLYVDPDASGVYISFDNLTFDGSSIQSTNGGALVHLANYNRMQNSVVRNYRPTQFSTGGDGNYHTNGILMGSNNIIRHSEFTNTFYAIYDSHGGNLVENNYIHDTGGYGIHHHHGGETPDCPDQASTHRNNFIIRTGNNIPSPQSGGGITTGMSVGTEVYNNVIIGSTPNGGGIQVFSRTCDTKVYNNTIVDNAGYCIEVGASRTTNTVLWNNICYNNGQGIIDGGINTDQQHNNPNGTNPLFTACATSQWWGTSQYCLTSGSPVINQGITVAAVTTDILGNTRGSAGSASDQGAYEFAVTAPTGTLGTFYAATTGTNADCITAKNAATPFTVTSAAQMTAFFACGLGGSTFQFKVGTYPGIFTGDNAPPAGTVGSPTTIMRFATDTVTFPIISIYRGGGLDDHLLFDGLTLDANLALNSSTFVVIGATDITFRNGLIQRSGKEAVYIDSSPSVTISNSIVNTNNTASALIQVLNSTNFILRQVQMYGGTGDGVSLLTTSGTVERNIIRNFTTGNSINVDSGGAKNILNNQIYSGRDGIRIRAAESGPMKVYNNTITANSGIGIQADAGSSQITLQNNIVFGNTGGAIVNPGNATLVTNVTTDPLFINAPTFNYHLSVGSTARDFGTPVGEITIDFDGTLRVGNPDAGAFEFTLPVYYVSAGGHSDTPNDANTCLQAKTITTPKATVLNALTNCITTPGDVLDIRGGTYNQAITTVVDGTALNPITIASHAGETAIITGGINLTAGNFLVFDRLLVDRLATGGNTTVTTFGLSIPAGLHDIKFQNGEIRNVVNHVVSILGNSNTIFNSLIHHTFIGSVSGQTRGFNAILLGGSSNTINKNHVHSSTGWGIELTGTANTVNDNVITQNRFNLNGTSDGARALVKGSVRISAGGRNKFINNIVSNGVGEGVRIDTANGSNTANEILNNTIYNNGKTGYAGIQEGLVYINAPSLRVQNNIVYINGVDTITNEGGSSGVVQDHNLEVTNPSFMDAAGGDFRLTAASQGVAIDTGINLSQVPVDFIDVIRPQNAVTDIGAYEFAGPLIPPPGGFTIQTQ